MAESNTARERAVKELRLGLVCYGGVSLAIYMHGITKELHKLVVASRDYERDATTNRFPERTTEHAYWEVLRRIEQETGVSWRVVIDVVSGTSAGGINGIFLAKALAHDVEQDGLRNLWMEKGDIAELIDAPAFVPRWLSRTRMGAALVRAARRGAPPLRGDLMCRWLLDALQGMGPRTEGSKTLVADGTSLELFVTLTDFEGYPRHIPIRGRAVSDARHRHVMAFTFDESTGADQFGKSHDRPLAFAARGTSCFPGAFPPISLDEFDDNVGGTTDDELAQEFFRIYELSGTGARKTYFVDGGVLDNRPFGHTIDAIQRKPARSEVVRRLVFIEPHPGGAKPPEQAKPGWLATIWGGLSSIPADEPILDELLRVRRRNEQIAYVRDVIRTRERTIQEAVDGLVDAGFPEQPSKEDLTVWNRKAHGLARQSTGAFYEAYLQIKAASVVRALADTLSCVAEFPTESNEAALVRATAALWAREQKVIGEGEIAEADRERFLRSFDLPYAARKLRFMVDGVNQMYAGIDGDTAGRLRLDAIKRELYDLRSRFTRVLSGRDLPDTLERGTRAALCREEVSQWARRDEGPALLMAAEGGPFRELTARYEALFAERFERFGEDLYASYYELTADSPELRRTLAARYIGFPIWDALLFPLLEIGELGEMDRIEVVRVSSNDAKRLSADGAEKLYGVGLHHFKAFFDRTGREKDYTWGRLDGAESIISMLTTEAQLGEVDEAYDMAFEAVFTEEENLEGARRLRDELAGESSRH